MKLLDKIFNRAKKSEPTPPSPDDKKIIENSLLFDARWYCETYGFGKYLDAANHYLTVGWRAGKNPSAFFSTNDYLKKNPDVDINPLVHFERFGLKEIVIARRLKTSCRKFWRATPTAGRSSRTACCESESRTPATPSADIAAYVAASARRRPTP